MQSEQSQQITARFFEALYFLKEKKVIRGKQTFTVKYGINRWNFNTFEKNPASDIFQVAWLANLVNDYNISAEWLLTGRGKMITL
jgi:hypothetical protein